MSKDIKIGDKVKLKCYRGEKDFAIYTVVALPYIEEKTKQLLVKTNAPGVPGHFIIPVVSIIEVISEEV